jgi:hypothetical protein
MIKLFSVYITLTMLSTEAGYTSSTLWSMIIGTRVGKACRVVGRLRTCSSHMTVNEFGMEVAYTNTSHIDLQFW